jgi:hypothetical protein
MSKGFWFMEPEIFQKATVIKCAICGKHGLLIDGHPKPVDCSTTWECKSCSDYQKAILIVDECGYCACNCGEKAHWDEYLTKEEIETVLNWGSTQDMLEDGFDEEDRALEKKLRRMIGDKS